MNRGVILKQMRKGKRCTQAQAAEGIGNVSLRSYVSYERGKEPRDKMFWTRAAKFFDCDVEDFEASISEDDTFESFNPADNKAQSMMLLAVTTLIGLAAVSLRVDKPAMATVSKSLGAISCAAGVSMGQNGTVMKRLADDEVLRQMAEKRQRFIRAVKGIICMALIEHGVQPIPEEAPDGGPDLIINAESGSIKSWWLCFEEGIVSKDDPNAAIENEFRANAIMARFWNYAPDPARKASVVVEDASLFDLLTTHKGEAYRGNLSVILVDIDEARLIREEYLTTFEEGANEESLMRVIG